MSLSLLPSVCVKDDVCMSMFLNRAYTVVYFYVICSYVYKFIELV